MEKVNNHYNQLNEDIFRYFNDSFGKQELDNWITWGAHLGDYHNFYIYLIAALIIISLTTYNNKHDAATLKEIYISWFTAGITLCLSLVVGHVFIQLIKNYTSMSRPFCEIQNIYVAKDVVAQLQCNMSFPSGHTSFLTIMIASFWPLFNRIFKTLSLILISFVAITRMAAGAHYPIDLLGAVIITLPLTLYIHHKVAHFIQHLEAKKNIFSKICTKLADLLR